jgi:hypothetical protein
MRLLVALTLALAGCDVPTHANIAESGNVECTVREVKAVRNGQPVVCAVYVCTDFGYRRSVTVPATLFCEGYP